VGGTRDGTHSTYLDLRFSGLRCGSVQNYVARSGLLIRSGTQWRRAMWRMSGVEVAIFIALVTAKGIYTASSFFECARRPLIIRLTAIPKNNNIC
jgi:hypothetical protein